MPRIHLLGRGLVSGYCYLPVGFGTAQSFLSTLDASAVLRELRALRDPAAAEGMRRFGITGKKVLGVSVPELRKLAKKVGKSHELALELWETGVHEARILASMVDQPERVTAEQMDSWTKDFDSWDVCDGCCGNLFDKTPFAYAKAMEWSKADEEFVKRAGFTLMAELAVHDKLASDAEFRQFFAAIKTGSTDERNFVKKAVNWALRQIGKRNARLNRTAVSVAEEIGRVDSRSAKWIAADALRELKSPQVARKLRAGA
jgi:3-methyladenine DNA glycosylase AlkD